MTSGRLSHVPFKWLSLVWTSIVKKNNNINPPFVRTLQQWLNRVLMQSFQMAPSRIIRVSTKLRVKRTRWQQSTTRMTPWPNNDNLWEKTVELKISHSAEGARDKKTEKASFRCLPGPSNSQTTRFRNCVSPQALACKASRGLLHFTHSCGLSDVSDCRDQQGSVLRVHHAFL